MSWTAITSGSASGNWRAYYLNGGDMLELARFQKQPLPKAAGTDTLRYVVPNSKLNAMRVINYSYQRKDRALSFRFPVGYDSDMDLVKRLIGKVIEDNPLTKPKLQESGEKEAYAPVRFMEFADSALIVGVTVYYDSSNPTELVKDEINTRVREALIANNIEIPYMHVTVEHKELVELKSKTSVE